MRIIEKKKKLRAILAALIILIGKSLNWSKISSVIENHVLTCAIRFFLFVFAFFFPDFVWLCYFLRSSVETLTSIPFGILFIYFLLLKFLISILCSLLILRFSYLYTGFLNNSNKNKKCGIILSVTNLVNKHSQSETKIREGTKFRGKINRGQFIYCFVYIYIFIFFLVSFVQSHLLIILL